MALLILLGVPVAAGLAAKIGLHFLDSVWVVRVSNAAIGVQVATGARLHDADGAKVTEAPRWRPARLGGYAPWRPTSLTDDSCVAAESPGKDYPYSL